MYNTLVPSLFFRPYSPPPCISDLTWNNARSLAYELKVKGMEVVTLRGCHISGSIINSARVLIQYTDSSNGTGGRTGSGESLIRDKGNTIKVQTYSEIKS